MVLHPNAVRTPGTNLQDLGIGPDDVMEITSGPNTGSYVLRAVVDEIAFVETQLPSNDPGPTTAEFRQNRAKIPTLTAAVVVNQPVFTAGVSHFAVLSVNIV